MTYGEILYNIFATVFIIMFFIIGAICVYGLIKETLKD